MLPGSHRIAGNAIVELTSIKLLMLFLCRGGDTMRGERCKKTHNPYGAVWSFASQAPKLCGLHLLCPVSADLWPSLFHDS